MPATPFEPVVVELSPVPAVMAAVRAVADRPGVVLFDSAASRGRLGRFSFLVADPFETHEVQRVEYGGDPFAELRSATRRFPCETIAGLPPFQGGAAGVLSYELGRAWERFPRATNDEFALPDLAVGLYDRVIAWDHEVGRCWLISQGWPETGPVRRRRRAIERADEFNSRMAPPSAVNEPSSWSEGGLQGHPTVGNDVPAIPGATSDFAPEAYLAAVQRVIDYVHAGDVFQTNLSQRLLFPARESPIDLYERLRSVNPAPFAGLVLWNDWAIASASPERFLAMTDREIETRPIKGTRRRRFPPEADLYGRDELRESEKDRAENVMIVDLLRNDLSRVCEPGSIRVPELCTVEAYETVQHLVSEVRGRLAERHDVWDLLAATFPGGSITGAPKLRAMEIIAELEPTARGPYCGSLFHAGFDGTLDSNILIRTFVQRGDWLQCRVGGGIVAQSDPADEYAETLAKAVGMVRALT